MMFPQKMVAWVSSFGGGAEHTAGLVGHLAGGWATLPAVRFGSTRDFPRVISQTGFSSERTYCIYRCLFLLALECPLSIFPETPCMAGIQSGGAGLSWHISRGRSGTKGCSE